MFERWVENGLLDTLQEEQIGGIAFSPLAGGLLTNRYLQGIPDDSRMMTDGRFLNATMLTDSKLQKIRALNAFAESRGQKLAQMALQWVLRQPAITSVLIGASKTSQIADAVTMLAQTPLSGDEIQQIEQILRTE